jgi:hypothetical protein
VARPGWRTPRRFSAILAWSEGAVAVSDKAYCATGVASGELRQDGEDVVLTFLGPEGPLRLALPQAELMALVSVCIGLAGQPLPSRGAPELATIPLADWRVGVTATGALALGLAPDAGGALAFHLTPRQAEEIAGALVRGARLAQADEPPARLARGGH